MNLPNEFTRKEAIKILGSEKAFGKLRRTHQILVVNRKTRKKHEPYRWQKVEITNG